jgi:hypothetical protein
MPQKQLSGLDKRAALTVPSPGKRQAIAQNAAGTAIHVGY